MGNGRTIGNVFNDLMVQTHIILNNFRSVNIPSVSSRYEDEPIEKDLVMLSLDEERNSTPFNNQEGGSSNNQEEPENPNTRDEQSTEDTNMEIQNITSAAEGPRKNPSRAVRTTSTTKYIQDF